MNLMAVFTLIFFVVYLQPDKFVDARANQTVNKIQNPDVKHKDDENDVNNVNDENDVNLNIHDDNNENNNNNNNNNDDFYHDYYIDNEIDMKPTYRSGVEKFLQGLTITLKTSKPTGFAGRVINGLPEAIRAFLLPKKEKKPSRSNDKGFGDILNTFSDDFKAIFPGTLWCGDGNVAQNPDDIGVFAETDECCKQHDHCPFTIRAGQSRELLKNNGMFTRSACSCDYKFYNCLKKVNSLVSENIGMTYFNILRPQCYGYHYPIERCEEYEK